MITTITEHYTLQFTVINWFFYMFVNIDYYNYLLLF